MLGDTCTSNKLINASMIARNKVKYAFVQFEEECEEFPHLWQGRRGPERR